MARQGRADAFHQQGVTTMRIQRVDYFHTTVGDEPGSAYQLLSWLSEMGINLLAFTGVPFGPLSTQLTIFPEDTKRMQTEAKKAQMQLDGPHPALLVQGDDKLGALAEIHEKLYDAQVHVSASSGVADGQGGYGYIIYVRPEEVERAAAALQI